MKFSPLVLASLLSGAAFSANAALPSLIWCNGCSDAAKASAAAAVTPSTTVEVYVGDLSANTVQDYAISADNTNVIAGGAHAMAAGGQYREATLISGTPSVVSAVQGAISFYHASPAGWNKGITINVNGQASSSVVSGATAAPPGGYNSGDTIPYSNQMVNVYGIINTGPQQNSLNSWIISVSTGANLIHSALQLATLTKQVDTTNLPNVAFTVVFYDNSKIEVEVDNSSIISAHIVQATAIDSHGNSVPYKFQSNQPSTYKFGPGGNTTDYQNWLHQISMLGYTYYGSQGLPGGGGSHGWGCTSVTDQDGDVIYSCFQF